MIRLTIQWRAIISIALTMAATASVAADKPAAGIAADERRQIDDELHSLGSAIAALRSTHGDAAGAAAADAAIFHKGAVWALRYDTEFTPSDVALIKRALARGRERIESIGKLDSKGLPWAARSGKLALGYFSRVDGSVQPYGVVVPAGYDPAKPLRLDVVLHGSTRPVGMSELRFIERFDAGDAPQTTAEVPFIELHPLGRVENCYRWAGETDVFEAIDDVCRRYNVDRDRVVLRGMSMGASGTWHLGLKHPDRFVALGPYCGYVDTHRFSETPLDTFVKVGPLPAHQELGLHMLDSVDYAANAGIVPAIACMGEKDVFFQAHVIMGEAMEREGLKMINLISPGTGHVIDPATHAEQMRQIGEYAAKGLDHAPRKLRFVAWTLKYSRCHWIELLGLEQHYARAEIAAEILDDGTIDIAAPKNVTRFAILPPAWPARSGKLRIAGRDVAQASGGRQPPDRSTAALDLHSPLAAPTPWPKLPASSASKPNGRAMSDNATRVCGGGALNTDLASDHVAPRAAPRGVVIVKRDGAWQVAGEYGTVTLDGKRPGLQGPIDDAFTEPFLCVRGTGKPWNPAVQSCADASLARFAYEWNRYFRGELPVKDDTAVTDDDLRSRHLILFGDPGSNSLISKTLPRLPLKWTRDSVRFAGEDHSAADHLPALIRPNPLATAGDRYVVLNSGHTFRESELARLNYLLFPRWGDWAILKVGARVPQNPSDPLEETVVRAGYFDEAWRPK